MDHFLNNFKLEPRIRDCLEKAGIYSVTDVVAASERDLLARANLSLEDIKKLRSVALSSAHFPQRVSSLLNLGCTSGPRWWGHRRSTGCVILDRFLKGGFPARGILELSGESGSGKTQLCLQAAVSAQIPLFQNNRQALGTVYICTEDPFPSNRLIQIIKTIPERYPEAKGSSFGDRIFVEHVCDLAGIKECLLVRVPHLLHTSTIPFGLIVIDSIAGVFRGSTEYDGSETGVDEQVKGVASGIRSRAMDLKEIAGELHSLASSHGLSVICVNQVSDAVDGIQGFGCNKKVPALGLSWANMVTTRLMASRTNEYFIGNSAKDETVSDHGRTLIRELEVIFSPELPPSKCRYVIMQSGVVGIE